MKQIGLEHLDDLAAGAVFLATGGGGDPHIAQLAARAVLAESGPARVVHPDELPDDAFIAAIGGIGAPSAGLELLPSIDEPLRALRAFEAHVGREVDGVVAFEIGGANSLTPIVAASARGVPVVDGDGMGRAFPEAQMMTFPIAGVVPTPAIVMDYAGNVITLQTDSTLTFEREVRVLSQVLGGLITTVEHPMTGAQIRHAVVPGTLTFATELGRTLRQHRGPAQEIVAPLEKLFASSIYGQLRLLYRGKVTDVQSELSAGFDRGRVIIDAFDGNAPTLRIEIQNEFIAAIAGEQVVASVPDLIVVLDDETSVPINAERIRFGQRVAVFGVGCPDFYRSERALKVVAPRCFGLDFDYEPLETLPAVPVNSS